MDPVYKTINTTDKELMFGYVRLKAVRGETCSFTPALSVQTLVLESENFLVFIPSRTLLAYYSCLGLFRIKDSDRQEYPRIHHTSLIPLKGGVYTAFRDSFGDTYLCLSLSLLLGRFNGGVEVHCK